MIRLLWVLLNLLLATLVFGGIVLVAGLLRHRGRLYFWCTQQWGRAVLWASGVRVVTHGMEQVAWEQPQVLVSNHISGYDIFALAAVIPVPYSFVGKKELNRIPFFGHVWQAAGHISIDRTNRLQAMESLRRAGEKIRRERSTVIIFPEGTRSRTGELQPFKKGAFMLALEAGVSVIPTVVRGSDQIWRPGTLRVRSRPIHVHFGSAIPVAGLAAHESDRLIERVRGSMVRMLESSSGSETPAR